MPSPASIPADVPTEITATRLYTSADDDGLFAPAHRAGPPPNLLNPAQLADLNRRFGSRADALIESHIQSVMAKTPKAPVIATPVKPSKRGRPPKVLANPFFGHLGRTSRYSRYPSFAMDVIVGISRLEWHSHRPGQVSKPLSVRRLMWILEVLEEVTAATVGELLGLATRHAQRYVKAIELALPRLMKCRSQSLIDDMEGNLPVGLAKFWEDTNPEPPCPADLAKLHQAMGIDAIELTPHV